MANHKRIRIFAGPNGSGKSTLKNLIESSFKIGIYVNADEILSKIRNTSRLEFDEYNITVSEDSLTEKYAQWPLKNDCNNWLFESNGITLRGDVDGYFASFLADFIRNTLLETADRFSFETVMSHPSKLEFIKNAKLKDYKVYLYFISLPDPALNILRVQTRVQAGGHDVDSVKIRDRYYRTMDLLLDAIKLCDNAYIFDNSSSRPQLISRKENGELRTEGTLIPQWYQTYVLDKINK